MLSDWGSALAGQEVQYVLVLRNDRTNADGGVENVVIQSNLPSNLQVEDAKVDKGLKPTIAGNTVKLNLPNLKPGETVEMAIRTKIKPGVAIGTFLIAQGQTEWQGLKRPLLSNIATVQVVGGTQFPTNTPTASRTATNTPLPSATPVPSITPTPPASPTRTPSLTPSPEQVVLNSGPTAIAPPSPMVVATAIVPTPVPNLPRRDQLVPLPKTSSGVPLMGVVLLGTVLLTRTVRLHRERERI